MEWWGHRLCSVAHLMPQAESLTLVAEIALGFLVASVRLRPIGLDRNARDAPRGLRLVGFCALCSSSQAHCKRGGHVCKEKIGIDMFELVEFW